MSNERFKRLLKFLTKSWDEEWKILAITILIVPYRNFCVKWTSLIFLINKLKFNFFFPPAWNFCTKFDYQIRLSQDFSAFFFFRCFSHFYNLTFQWWCFAMFWVPFFRCIVTRWERRELHSFHFAFTHKISSLGTVGKIFLRFFNLCFMFCTIKFLWLCLDVYKFIMFRSYISLLLCFFSMLHVLMLLTHFLHAHPHSFKKKLETTTNTLHLISHFTFFFLLSCSLHPHPVRAWLVFMSIS